MIGGNLVGGAITGSPKWCVLVALANIGLDTDDQWPSVAELAAYTGQSPTEVHAILRELAK